jgi:hypothetical protein
MTLTTPSSRWNCRSGRHWFVAICATAASLATTASAVAATERQADTKARRAANHYTNTYYGIGFSGPGGWRYWASSCRARWDGGWRCRVTMNGRQCVGTLKLTELLRPYAYRIGCGD